MDISDAVCILNKLFLNPEAACFAQDAQCIFCDPLTGNVGIGTTPSSEAKLQVEGSLHFVHPTDLISFADAGTLNNYHMSSTEDIHLYLDSNNNSGASDTDFIIHNDVPAWRLDELGRQVLTSGGEILTVLGNGNVGIGTTNPSASLTIRAAPPNDCPHLRLIRGIEGDERQAWDITLDNDAFNIQDRTASVMDDSGCSPDPAGRAVRLTIASATGNVGIGTTLVLEDTRLNVHVGEKQNAHYGQRITGAIPNNLISLIENTSPHQDASADLFLNTGQQEANVSLFSNEFAIGTKTNVAIGFHVNGLGSERMRITQSGKVSIGNPPDQNPPTTLYVDGTLCATQGINCGSSRELKENVAELSSDDAMKVVCALKPVTFSYKADESKDSHVGFIAEDSPALVTTPDKKAMSPMDVIAVLAKVVQEQQRAIDEQRILISAMQTEIKDLQVRLTE